MFNEFFELSPADYVKVLINTNNPDKNKEFVAEIKDRISDLKDRIKQMIETGKKIKMLMIHERLLKKFLITTEILKKFSRLHQKLIKENQNQSLKKALLTE